MKIDGIPTDPFDLLILGAIYGSTLILRGISLAEAEQRLASGMASNAEHEGRELTPDELRMSEILRDRAIARAEGAEEIAKISGSPPAIPPPPDVPPVPPPDSPPPLIDLSETLR
jgi:hypothetical protein